MQNLKKWLWVRKLLTSWYNIKTFIYDMYQELSKGKAFVKSLPAHILSYCQETQIHIKLMWHLANIVAYGCIVTIIVFGLFHANLFLRFCAFGLLAWFIPLYLKELKNVFK